MQDVPPQDREQHGPGTGSQPSCAQLAVTQRSWQVAAGAAQQGLAHLCLCRTARWHSRAWSNGAQPGGTVPGAVSQDLPWPWASKKILCLLPSRQRCASAAAEDRTGWRTRGTRQSLPEVFSTQSAAWDSSAKPEFLQKRPSPDREVSAPTGHAAPFIVLPHPCAFHEMGQTPSASPGTCCQGDCSCKNMSYLLASGKPWLDEEVSNAPVLLLPAGRHYP